MKDLPVTVKHDTAFFERYARISLINIVDKRFEGLKNKDRPDLQDKKRSVGIEVTRAIRENKSVALALINEMAGNISQEDWLDMTKYGYAYGLYKDLVGKIEYTYWSTALPMKKILENKINKVCGGFYGNFNEYGLYIFVKEELNDVFIKQTIDYAIQLQKLEKEKYTKIYISQISDLFVCDLGNASFEKFPVSEILRRKFYREAIL